ncbi:uncharacterized protein [Zea mays]|uniref:uncharacterized protein n=1 Tax=Zea mays TaxID=4577 RepID=UPI0009AA28C6|nr:uncharacterized protein LOC103646868 [Zea mays]|eukprot:XP_008669719.2 uncharacterized protein LOC103646868 [Zea mays]
MEQLVGVHHHHHSLSPRAPRTPTRPQPHPHPLLHHLPSNRFRDLHSQIHNHIHPAVPAASRVLRATPPFFLTLLASVYLLASVTIFSTPTPLLRLRLASPRPLILPKPAPPPPAPELFDLDVGSVRVCLTNVGAAVTSFLVPDKNGVLADVVLGFDSLDPYLAWGCVASCPPALECRRLSLTSGSRGCRRSPHRGPTVARPLDRGAAATAPPIWESSPLLRIEEPSPPCVQVGEPSPPQHSAESPPPHALSDNLPSNALGWAALMNQGGASKTKH